MTRLLPLIYAMFTLSCGAGADAAPPPPRPSGTPPLGDRLTDVTRTGDTPAVDPLAPPDVPPPVPNTLAARWRAEPVAWSAPRAPTADLAAVAAESLRAWEAMDGLAAAAVTRAAPPDAFAGSPADTLRWVVAVATADRANGADRLADPIFLDRCLATWRWVPSVARDGEALRLTRYLVYEVTGRPTSEGSFQHALWRIPNDERELSAEEAEARKDTLDRFRYTRQDVAAGVYREGGAATGRAEPLVWLTHADHEQAILQGTVAVTLPGEASARLYNVHRPNAWPYDRTVRDTTKQKRYWYFQPKDAVRGWAAEPVPGAALRPYVAVAGDLDGVGYGRLLALRNADGLRLVVLADTGGAFEGNHAQLDLYTGLFPSRKAFDTATASVGSTAPAWLVAARPEVTGCAP